MEKLHYFLWSFVKLPSTILQELLHASMVLFFSLIDTLFNVARYTIGIEQKSIIKLTDFNIFPNFKNRTLGHIKYINSSPYQRIFISIAPLISWIALIYIYHYTKIIYITDETIELNPNKYSYIEIIFIGLISIYLSWSGKLSSQDLKVAIRAVFSLQILFIVCIVLMSYYIKDIYIIYLEEAYAYLENFIKNLQN